MAILLGNWLLEGSDNWIYCGGDNRVLNISRPTSGNSSSGTFALFLENLPQDLIDINNNLSTLVEEIGEDYEELLLGDSKILKV